MCETISRSKTFALNLDRLMNLRGLTDRQLSEATGVSDRAITSARQGNTNPQDRTIRRIEDYFGIYNLANRLLTEEELGPARGYADSRYGGYRLDDLKYLCGDYFFFRRSFDYPDGLVCSFVKIEIDEPRSCMIYNERQRNVSRSGEHHPHDHRGVISTKRDTNIIQMRDETDAVHRVHNFNISRLGGDGESIRLFGVLQTLNYDSLRGYYPAVTPVLGNMSKRLAPAEIEKKIGSYQISEFWDERVPGQLETIKKNYIA